MGGGGRGIFTPTRIGLSVLSKHVIVAKNCCFQFLHLTLNDLTKFEQLVYYVFFLFVNIFTNGMIKTPILLLVLHKKRLKSEMRS